MLNESIITGPKTYRANSLARELRKIGGTTIDDNDGHENFIYHWFHQNTILIYDKVYSIGHNGIFIGCGEKRYTVAVHVIHYGSVDDIFRFEFKEISGFALLVSLVRFDILSYRFTPAIDPNYSKILQL